MKNDWFYFKWPHPRDEEEKKPPTHRQRETGGFLEIQSRQNDRWITVKYLSLAKEKMKDD